MAQTYPGVRFWDRYARKYAAQPISDQTTYERKLEMTRAHLRPTDQVLEIGAGTGSTALAHAPYVAGIRSTDFSAKMMEIARGKASAAGITNVTFEQASDTDIAVAPGSVDVVLALNLLHLLPDPAATLVRIRTWLKPGGLLVASTACVADMIPVFRLIGPPLGALGLIPKVKIFRQRAYETWIAEAGFEVVEVWHPGKKSGLFHILRAPTDDSVS